MAENRSGPGPVPRPSVSHPDTDEHRSVCPECRDAYGPYNPANPANPASEYMNKPGHWTMARTYPHNCVHCGKGYNQHNPWPELPCPLTKPDALLAYHLHAAAVALHAQWDAERALEAELGFNVDGLGRFILEHFVMSPDVDPLTLEEFKRWAQEHRVPGELKVLP